MPLDGLQLGLLDLQPPVGVLGLGHLQGALRLYVSLGVLPVAGQPIHLMGELLDDDADPVQVDLGLLPLAAGAVDVRVEAGDAGDGVDDAPPLHGPHLDDAGDVSLLDEVVSVRAYPGLGQEGVELGHGGLAVVDEEIGAVVGAVV